MFAQVLANNRDVSTHSAATIHSFAVLNRVDPGKIITSFVPIMLGDAVLAQQVAAKMLEKGVYVVGFFYPVVPMGQARIRVQLCAMHTEEDIAFALEKFAEVKKELGL